jgi:2,3-dihydroxy-2,3-dihydrophenylpropionate dehydrogenase
MTGRLAGSVIVCTGGGSGIGRAAVDAFLDEGARVGLLELDAGKVSEFDKSDDRVFAIQGDATIEGDNQRLISEAKDRWGRVDTLATFVGIFDGYTPLTDLPGAALAMTFEEVFDINVLSTLMSASAALGELRESRGSIIVTLSSSSFYPGRGGVLYVASKFALRGVVIQLAHELAPVVRVNGVAPGGTLDTDLRSPRALGHFEERLADRPGRRESLEQRTPLHLALGPSDHTGAYIFLASKEASAMTGEVIRVDGGLGAR